MNIHPFLILLLICCLSCSNSTDQGAGEDCIFDLDTQTDAFVRALPELKDYTWNDRTKTARILLQSGDSLVARRGGCDHFGVSGSLRLDQDEHSMQDLAHWIGQARWISSRLMPESDWKAFDQMIELKQYEDHSTETRIHLIFTGHNYSMWYMTVDWMEGAIWVETGYDFG
ncbi:hypothetical protein [Pontibacter sp. G13]|uniref:hypothetical protein n=1 Tax=Pontibacter sp. G13 TaxID=3074898 RepID=UPI00288A4465|nr:hypothetical protein [Pontibacter sp. G13]WNJ19046.1 hypothetical protein RJD25_01025 [Pontibacter sp. G13]